MQPNWRIELLGALQVRSEAATISRFRTRRVGTLLAYLALYQDRSHSREELADLLWPEVSEEVSRRNLRQALSSLRKHLEPPPLPAGSVLVVKQSSVRLNLETVSTDVSEFERLLAKGNRAGTPETRFDALDAAIAVYKGALLPGHYEEWALTERQRLEDVHTSALNRLVNLAESLGKIDPAIAYIRMALVKEPLNEELHNKLMGLYLDSARPAAAMKQFKDLERILRGELGCEPGRESRELATRARAKGGGASVKRAPKAFTEIETKVTPEEPKRVRLPVQLTRFHGRARELAYALDRLSAEGDRLVSLVGPAGVGKTRLSLEVARRLAESDWNAWFVPLADISDEAMILEAIADVMSVRDARRGQPLDRIKNALNGPHNLIVLDNLEHIVDGAAAIVSKLLQDLPSAAFLTSTRQALTIEGEHEIDLEPLPVPAAAAGPANQELLAELSAYPSIQLFIDRCQAFHPDYQLTIHNGLTVAAICERLEGLPLALEIAAGLSNAFTATQLLQNLENRLDVIKNRRRDASPRHQSLRAAIEYSYDLLPEDLQALFAALSVFRGGFSISAVGEVCIGDVSVESETSAGRRRRRERCLRSLLDLQERSLLHADEGAESSEARFRILESFREFGREQLSQEQEEALQDRQAAYFLELAGRSGKKLSEFVQVDRDNLVTAIQTLVERGRLAEAIRLIEATVFDGRDGHTLPVEVNLAMSLLEDPRIDMVPEEGRTVLYRIAANHNLHHGDYDAAEAYCARILELARAANSDRLTAVAYGAMGVVAGYKGDNRKAFELNQKTLEHAEPAKDFALIERAYLGIGTHYWTWNDLAAAEAAFLSARRASQIYRGSVYWLVLYNLARVNLDKGCLDEGMQIANEALRSAEGAADIFGISMSLSMIARYHWLSGNLKAAFATSHEALVKRQRHGFSYWLLNAIQFHAYLALDLGMAKEAAVLLAASKTTLNLDRERDRNEYSAAVNRLEKSLSEEVMQNAWAQGLSMSINNAFAYATNLPLGS